MTDEKDCDCPVYPTCGCPACETCTEEVPVNTAMQNDTVADVQLIFDPETGGVSVCVDHGEYMKVMPNGEILGVQPDAEQPGRATFVSLRPAYERA